MIFTVKKMSCLFNLSLINENLKSYSYTKYLIFFVLFKKCFVVIENYIFQLKTHFLFFYSEDNYVSKSDF